MWSNDPQSAARLCDAMQLIHEAEDVGNMFDHVATNYFLELVISEWIRKRSEIVDDISMTQTVRVDTDGAGKFVLTTTDVEDLFLR